MSAIHGTTADRMVAFGSAHTDHVRLDTLAVR